MQTFCRIEKLNASVFNCIKKNWTKRETKYYEVIRYINVTESGVLASGILNSAAYYQSFYFINGCTIYLFSYTLKFILKFTLKLLLHISD
jgi:hypothetical protein